jgi:hypothetical protein
MAIHYYKTINNADQSSAKNEVQSFGHPPEFIHHQMD